MKRVTGIGGVFFKVENPDKTKNWYRDHLGIETNEFGALFQWRSNAEPEKKCSTTWSPFKKDTNYFEPSKKEYMLNYRVENLVELLEALRAEGVEILGEIEEYSYGKFGWIMDIDGNKIELWEPIDETFENIE